MNHSLVQSCKHSFKIYPQVRFHFFRRLRKAASRPFMEQVVAPSSSCSNATEGCPLGPCKFPTRNPYGRFIKQISRLRISARSHRPFHKRSVVSLRQSFCRNELNFDDLFFFGSFEILVLSWPLTAKPEGIDHIIAPSVRLCSCTSALHTRTLDFKRKFGKSSGIVVVDIVITVFVMYRM